MNLLSGSSLSGAHDATDALSESRRGLADSDYANAGVFPKTVGVALATSPANGAIFHEIFVFVLDLKFATF